MPGTAACPRTRRILLMNEEVALIPHVESGLVGEALRVTLAVKWPGGGDSSIPCWSSLLVGIFPLSNKVPSPILILLSSNSCVFTEINSAVHSLASASALPRAAAAQPLPQTSLMFLLPIKSCHLQIHPERLRNQMCPLQIALSLLKLAQKFLFCPPRNALERDF